MKRAFLIFSFSLLALLLAGCGGSAQTDDSAAAIEAYLAAIVEKKAAALSNLTCAEWEAGAQLEYDSFAAVEASLEGLNCSESGSEGDDRLVQCSGKIVTSYNGEAREFDLSLRTYLVRQEDGEWRMCGYR